jgi:AcrR family transcriptional regulator
MARTIDVEAKTARLHGIAEAVSRVMARNGAGLASLRDIADEMGSSVGVLTHYFQSKEELYLYAWRYLVGEIFSQALAAGEGAVGLDRIERILLAALPTTSDRRERWRQWMAFLGAAVSGGLILEEERRNNVRFLRALRRELETCVEEGRLSADLDIDSEARSLMSLVDGLGVDAVLHPVLFSAPEQKQVVRRHLARLSAPSSYRPSRRAQEAVQ